MRHITETTEAALKKLATRSKPSQPKISQKTDIPKSWISALFLKLQARYGHKWTSAIEGIEADAIAEWSSYLGGLDGESIKRGLDSWRGDWPPTAEEFRKACKQYVDPSHRIFDKSRLIEKKADPAVAKAALDEMLGRSDKSKL